MIFFMDHVSIFRIMCREIKKSWCSGVTGFYMPCLSYQEKAGEPEDLIEQIAQTIFPLFGQASGIEDYQTDIESDLSYEMILALEAADENYIDPVTGELIGNTDVAEIPVEEMPISSEQPTEPEPSSGTETAADTSAEGESVTEQTPAGVGTNIPVIASGGQKAVSYSPDKLADFDYLIRNFYQVDNTTTINGSKLNANDMLSKSMKLTHDASSPQILIYHSHSQEGYADSVPGDPSMSVVGVADYLTEILTEQYGLNVIHHTGEYDVGDRDHAYSRAGPALEQLLAEHPEVEVVIDLHRDGVGENTRLVTNINGTEMAKIMFVNGLSYTTSAGEIDYLYNPNLSDNLAFSFQMQLTAAEYYPGFTRGIYLRGYRYNLHYCPKSLLVEVGAQTNTLQEAKNAMIPLADILNKVVTGD